MREDASPGMNFSSGLRLREFLIEELACRRFLWLCKSLYQGLVSLKHPWSSEAAATGTNARAGIRQNTLHHASIRMWSPS
jgi:hypothetical protein